MAGGGELDAYSLEFTPTWIVAMVCSIIVSISLVAERLLHSLGKYLKRKEQKPLFEALLKIKEELMLLGFISLLLSVFQNTISKICIHESWTNHLLPCNNKSKLEKVAHVGFISGIGGRKLLSSEGNNEYCTQKGKVPLLSTEALHHLHIFIFVLAIVHVTFCVLTIVFGGIKIRMWEQWEDSIPKDKCDTTKHHDKLRHVHQHPFINDNFLMCGINLLKLGWLSSFFKQFHGSVTKSVYITLRRGFIANHCPGNPKFDFHKYMVRALQADFKKVIGISCHLWIFVVIFLLLNVEGWHAYFWISFIPLFLLLAVGAKLAHVISQLAREVAEKKGIRGDLVVKPSNKHFWFGRPRIVLYLIHFILFQNAFEFAIFFWIWVQFGFDSCIMGKVCFIIPRLVIGVFIQVLCSYSTLPLYAIVTRIGDSLNKAIFDERVEARLDGWVEDARLRAAAANGSTQGFGCCPIWIRPIQISTMGNSSNKAIFDERLQEAQESRLRATAANGSTQGGAAHQGGSTEGSTTVHIPMGEQPEPAQEIANEDAGDIEGSSTTVHIPMGKQLEPAQEIAKEDAGDIEGSSTTAHIPTGKQPEPAQEIAKEDAGDIEGSSTTVHIPMGEQPEPAQNIAKEDAGDIEGSTTVHIPMGKQPEPAQNIAKEEAGDIAVIIDQSTEP